MKRQTRGEAMRTTTVLVAGLALAAWTVAAQAQQGPGGFAPGPYSGSQIGQAAANASSKDATDERSKVKANEKAYNAALRNLPEKQYDPWRSVR
jgi:hypothetical protein